jgi:hypothetical protein
VAICYLGESISAEPRPRPTLLARDEIQYKALLAAAHLVGKPGTARGAKRVKMRIRAALWTAALALGSALLAVPAAGQQPVQEPAGQPARDAKDALRSADRAVKGAAQEVKKDLQQAAADVSKEVREWRDKLRATRQERRAEERKAIRDKWGALVDKPRVREELTRHARRMAYLNYMERLAKDLKKKDSVVDRVEKVRDREKARHEKRMDALRAKGGEE